MLTINKITVFKMSDDYILLENNEINKYRNYKFKLIILGGFLQNILFFINNLVYDNIMEYIHIEYLGSFILSVFIIEILINISILILIIYAYYNFIKKKYYQMKKIIFVCYGINLSYSLIMIFIPWILIGDNLFLNLTIYLPLLNLIFNIILTFALFIPNIKNAAQLLYTFTNTNTYYLISLVAFTFELFLTLIIFGVGIQILSIYQIYKNDIGPLLSFVILCILFIIYNIFKIKFINNKDKIYNYISIFLLVSLLSIGLYLLIYFDFGFNIINSIFLGSLSSLSIFEFIETITH